MRKATFSWPVAVKRGYGSLPVNRFTYRTVEVFSSDVCENMHYELIVGVGNCVTQ